MTKNSPHFEQAKYPHFEVQEVTALHGDISNIMMTTFSNNEDNLYKIHHNKSYNNNSDFLFQ